MDDFELSKESESLWSIAIDRFGTQWPGFVYELVDAHLQALASDRDSTVLETDGSPEESKRQSKSYAYTICMFCFSSQLL